MTTAVGTAESSGRRSNAVPPAVPAAASPAVGEPSARPESRTAVRRPWALLGVAVGAACLLCLVLGARALSTGRALAGRQARAVELAADVQAIAGLRTLPEQALEIGVAESDLLKRVAQAMDAAGLAAAALASTVPQAPRKQPGARYAEVVHRLTFEGVELEPLVRFGHALVGRDPALHIVAIQLRAAPQPQQWNVDVSVAYWILAPE